jgi:hypothetical protein
MRAKFYYGLLLLRQIRVFGYRGVAPKLLQFVESAGIAVKNVHHRVEIVHNHPRTLRTTFQMAGCSLVRFFYLSINAVGNRSYLNVGIAFANDEKVGWSVVKFSEVKFYNFFTFEVLNGVNDDIVKHFSLSSLFFV